ncbi:MAG: DUF1311 domain-containing protein [Alphaproteobacteria bacterium]|nr:DUF1311 domain-containing protein [Alphaproteobacteria bacterium]
MKARRTALALALCLASPAHAWTGAGGEAPWRDTYVSAEIQAICEAAVQVPLPPAPEPKAPPAPDCDVLDLYYGIGGPVDHAAARDCAHSHPEEGKGWEDAVLMMLYANGYAVERNLDAATRLACEHGGAPMAIGLRVQYLQDIRALPPGGRLRQCAEGPHHHQYSEAYCRGAFDLCDDATSGYMMGWCVAIASGKAAAARDARLESLSEDWPEAHKAALGALKVAAWAYIEAHGGNEVDHSGTVRAAIQTGKEDEMRDAFVERLERLEDGWAPAFLDPGQALREADSDLNAAYRVVMGCDDFGPISGITADGIRETQRLWIPYRDAWAALAAARWPGAGADAIRAHLIRERTGILKGLQFDCRAFKR